jgi:hypothetical protein
MIQVQNLVKKFGDFTAVKPTASPTASRSLTTAASLLRVEKQDFGRMPQELKQQTKSESLEQAFLALTGSTIRDETATTSTDQLRQMTKMWSQRR